MRFAIGIGSNLGDREGYFRKAAKLCTRRGLNIIAKSSLIENPPMPGGPDGQGPFLNGVWIIETSLGAHSLLVELQNIERACGRVRSVHWGSRSLDLDIVLCENGYEINSTVLQIPHPGLAQRSFVLEPLRELVPNWTFHGVCIADLSLDD